MDLIPTPLPTTIDLLLASETRIFALTQTAFDRSGSSSSFSSGNERTKKRAIRVRYDLNNVCSLLEQLRRFLLERWDSILPERKELVGVRGLAAVLGAGAMVFNDLGVTLAELARLYELERKIRKDLEVGKGKEKDKDVVRWMRHGTRRTLWELLNALKDVGTAVRFVLTILESPSDEDVEASQGKLCDAVVGILGEHQELAVKINELYPEPEADHLEQAAPASMSETSSQRQDTPQSRTECRMYRAGSPSPAGVGIVCSPGDSDSSDSETGVMTPSSSEFPFSDAALEGHATTLADVEIESILIPVLESLNPETPSLKESTPEPTPTEPSQRNSASLKVITVSATGVDISPLPIKLDGSLSFKPAVARPTALSADTVFQLPEVTDQIILDFFHHALGVSRFATQFADGKRPDDGWAEHQSVRDWRFPILPSRQLRVLCAALYDELVRRNVEDQHMCGTRTTEEGSTELALRFGEPKGVDAERAHAKAKLAGLGDEEFASVVAGAIREMERRCQTCPATSQYHTGEAAAIAPARTSEHSDWWSVEAVREGRIWDDITIWRTGL